MSGRRVDVALPSGGWIHPWPNVFEMAEAFGTAKWTLVCGLMVQAHAIAHGVPVGRPTLDIDVLLHVEIVSGVSADAAFALEQLGYTLRDPFERNGVAYRFERGGDRIDVMSPDHARPPASLRRRPMFVVDGGKQAVERAMTLGIDTGAGDVIELSVPDELGSLVLKGAAYLRDRRDRDRHLFDAAVLAACIDNPIAERPRLKGSDSKRLRSLACALADPRPPSMAHACRTAPHSRSGRNPHPHRVDAAADRNASDPARDPTVERRACRPTARCCRAQCCARPARLSPRTSGRGLPRAPAVPGSSHDRFAGRGRAIRRPRAVVR